METTSLATTQRARAAEGGPPSALLGALRAGTRESHDALDRLPRLAALWRPGLSLDAYLDVLERFWRLHATCESQLDLSEVPEGLRRRTNLERLARDLAGVAHAPPPPRAPRVSPARSVGLLYVLEGSALGGLVLRRHVAAAPALAARMSFLGRSAPEVVSRWRAFRQWLATLDARGPEFEADAVAAARDAFRRAHRIFTEDIG